MNIRFSNAFDSATATGSKARFASGVSPRLRLIASLAGVVLLVAAVWILLNGGLFAPAEKPRAAPPVKVAVAVNSNVTVTERTIGTVIANATVQVTARVEGQLMSAAFKEGDLVHKGDLLFRLDPRPFEAALQQAQAQLAKDQAMLTSAQNDRKRYETLFKAGASSSQQRDQADANAKGLVASVAADRAAVRMAQLNVSYTQIRSPIDGKTGPILIQPGNMIAANGTAPLVTVTQIRPVKVSFSLPQSDLPRIQDRQQAGGLTAAIDLHDQSGKPLIADVDFTGNAVSNTTGTIELRATYANQDMRLVPGQLIDVSVALNNLANAIVVPREAVNIGPDNRYVYVVKDGKADMRIVKVLFDAGATMAIEGDVKAGDMVVTDGQLRVLPGKPVSIAGDNGGGHASAKK
ncbi:MAG: efflux RND transporter periplasmic adaptor subunit [Alphaproteobacteria bacterium]|nr:efflux RND transporter periplasmic adaptor subunit [Alphaproteobacteria bacterium]